MNIEEIDQFMQRIAGVEDENIITEESKKMIDRIFETVGYLDKDGNMVFHMQNISWVNRFIETGACKVCHKYFADKIPYLSVLFTAFVENARESSQKKDTINSMNEDMRKVITSPDFLPESPTEEDVKLFDGIVYIYCFNKLASNQRIDEECLEGIRRLEEAAPKIGKDIEDTVFYKSLWEPYSDFSEELANSISQKSREEYEEYLFATRFEEYIDSSEFAKYDRETYMYLSKYGDDVSYEVKEKLLGKIIKCAQVGTLEQSKAVTKYFFAKQGPDEFEALFNHGLEILADIFGQAVEYRRRKGNAYIRRISKDEMNFLERYSQRIQELNGNSYSNFIEDVLQERIETVLGSFYDYSNEDVIRFAKKTIDMVEEFKTGGVPPICSLSNIIYMVRKIPIYDCLDRNFYREDIGDPTVNKHGLTKFDYADKALELIFDLNPYAGIDRVLHYGIRERYEENGRNFYDSRAARKMTEVYIDDKNLHGDERFERAIIDFVRTVSRKPDFNLFKEQQISELLQTARIKGDQFAKRVEEELRAGIKDNPSYADLSNENASKYVAEFLEKYNYVTLTDEHEAEFDRFLQAASIVRLDSEYGTLPKEITDYIIRQFSVRTTLLNRKSEKYMSVAERAIENTGLIRLLAQEDTKPFMYKFRDCILFEGVSGQKDRDGNISIKRSYMNDLKCGNIEVIGTMFHENTHGGQDSREGKFILKSFNEFMMIKEECLMKKKPGYYYENYNLMFIEIEAREHGASDTSGYIDMKINPALKTKLAHNPKDSIISEYYDRFTVQSEAYMRNSEKEATLYEVALDKNVNNQRGTINELFDKYMTPEDVRSFMEVYPALAYEYNEDGTLKTTGQQIETVFQYPEISLDVMRQVIKHSSYKKYSLDTFDSIDRVMQAVGNEEEKNFIEGVVADKIPEIVSRIKMSRRNCYPSDAIEEVLASYISLNRVIGYVEENMEGNDTLSVFAKYNAKGKRPLDEMQDLKAMLEEQYPGLAERVQQVGINPIFNAYQQLKALGNDVRTEDKDAVAAKENFAMQNDDHNHILEEQGNN